jgi:PAS domain S-box-containing protein
LDTDSIVASHIQDAAERRAEEAIGRSEERFRKLVEHSSDPITLLDTAGRIIYSTPSLHPTLGYGPCEITGQSALELVHPDDRPLAERLLRDVSCAPGHSADADLRLRHQNGSWRDLEVAAVNRVDDVAIGAVVVTHHDVTERKTAERALRESQERLRVALEATGLGPWDWDLRTNVTEFSPEWKRQLGYEPHEILNQYEEWESRLHPQDRERVLEALRAYLDGRQPEYAVEFRMRHKDGSYRWIYTRGVALRDGSGKLTHMLGCHLDITARKHLEEQFRQAQKMEAVGQLAGGVAHDFNNLLTVISGNSEMLLSELPPNESWQELISEVREAGQRAAMLTRQLLAFSRQTVLEPEVLDLNDVVRENEKMLRRLIGEDVQLKAVLDPALAPVKVDAGQIGQVIMNLVINARDAMPTGGNVIIETRNVTLDEASTAMDPEAKPGRYVMLAVSDTGVGMTPDVQARVFEPFFTTKGAGKGTGLGLATVYGIVKQSGASISVSSEPGRGTTFKIRFPVAETPGSTGESVAHVATVALGTETILLVEDEAAVRSIVGRVLRRAGYTVLEASRGTEAVRLAGTYAGTIHLLITDVVMPEMGGRELVDRLAPLRSELKVLYLSGYTQDATIRHGVLQAEVAFLPKPFTIAALTNKVRQVLDEAA